MQPTPRVLDPCSGSRMMWFDRLSPDVIFGDTRQEEHTLHRIRPAPKPENRKLEGGKKY